MSLRAASKAAQLLGVETLFLHHFIVKTEHVPRQARDNQTQEKLKRLVSAGMSSTVHAQWDSAAARIIVPFNASGTGDQPVRRS
jgi:hypothetical protein